MNLSPRHVAVVLAITVSIVACNGSARVDVDVPQSGTSSTEPIGDLVDVRIDATEPGDAISPFIRGLSSDFTADDLRDLGIRLNSWGGNPSTRYNYEIGHAWNHGRDYEFRNTNYDITGDAARDFLERNRAAGVESRLAVPTLGWVAANDDQNVCSFPTEDGRCRTGAEVGGCNGSGPLAEPTIANTSSTEQGVSTWIASLIAGQGDIRFIAMDNEPELWGYTHYDVHPACPTYEEILDKYVTYSKAVRAVAPTAELTGPVMCCWFEYWGTAPGPADGSGDEFLGWFLREVANRERQAGQRLIDVVDVHFYPQGGVYNDNTDPETNARRLRSTRALWDDDYVDESWIGQPIAFIPRLQAIIEESYPGLPVLISEWNFGADSTMNGAVAIAEVLGVYGREGVYAATYWREPPRNSPGYFAFKMHGNYDDAGSSFVGSVLTASSSDMDSVSAYAALDPDTNTTRIMLINKDPEAALSVALSFDGFQPADQARRWTYGIDNDLEIIADSVAVSSPVELPGPSITVLELDPGS